MSLENLEEGQVVCVLNNGDLQMVKITEIDFQTKIFKAAYKEVYNFNQVVTHISKSTFEYLAHIRYAKYNSSYALTNHFLKVEPKY